MLEEINRMPAARKVQLLARLDELEWELTKEARPRPGACELLGALTSRDARLGVLTRNSRRNALETLRIAGLDHFFAADSVLGRDCARPKPFPDGIETLLERWSGRPDQAVMVGDYKFDLLAGREAGTSTVLLADGSTTWSELADLQIADLHALLPHLERPE